MGPWLSTSMSRLSESTRVERGSRAFVEFDRNRVGAVAERPGVEPVAQPGLEPEVTRGSDAVVDIRAERMRATRQDDLCG